MNFTLPQYHVSDFQETRFQSAPEARFESTPKNGVAPEDYRVTTIYPEYFKARGWWLLAEEGRADCVAALRDGKIAAVKFRDLKADEPAAVGRTEDASEGIYVYPFGFAEGKGGAETLALRQGRPRETVRSMDYGSIYESLRHEKGHGHVLWVMGPACTFDHDARTVFVAPARDGYIHDLLTSNALAIHDLRTSYLGTIPGQDIHTQKSMPSGHYNRIDTLNAIHLYGSTAAFVGTGKAKGGIIYGCVRNHIPYMLVGSVRDDGPLFEVYGGVCERQDAMRALVRETITVIYIASTLHIVTIGNVTPSYRVVGGVVRPTYFYSANMFEFAVNKFRDWDSLSVRTIVTNVQDFVVNVCKGVL